MPGIEKLIALLVGQILESVSLASCAFEQRTRDLCASQPARDQAAAHPVRFNQAGDHLGVLAAPSLVDNLVEPVEEPVNSPLTRKCAQAVLAQAQEALAVLTVEVLEERKQPRGATIGFIETAHLDPHGDEAVEKTCRSLARGAQLEE